MIIYWIVFIVGAIVGGVIVYLIMTAIQAVSEFSIGDLL